MGRATLRYLLRAPITQPYRVQSVYTNTSGPCPPSCGKVVLLSFAFRLTHTLGHTELSNHCAGMASRQPKYSRSGVGRATLRYPLRAPITFQGPALLIVAWLFTFILPSSFSQINER